MLLDFDDPLGAAVVTSIVFVVPDALPAGKTSVPSLDVKSVPATAVPPPSV